MTAFALAILTLLLTADTPSGSLFLDRGGREGIVAFDHGAHVKAPRDPSSPLKVSGASSCGGCHHTHDATGVIQLAKCAGCHGPEGDPRNPRSVTFDEENRKSAFHDLCIGCHADLAKEHATRTGPVDCADCHKMSARGEG